ncbi:hypothetical protein QR721_05025 [Aciduricibacillus chroicocephali]|uniref:DUF4871 domain-containing protein n=1 Tax=Aciduricibacillus chroicocephali TaxID=3054939 RepID=A0ABY9KXT5_9BACI|nr:hypothetical protein QR721_05025 [Bacillaceae bacterium 44XB]
MLRKNGILSFLAIMLLIIFAGCKGTDDNLIEENEDFREEVKSKNTIKIPNDIPGFVKMSDFQDIDWSKKATYIDGGDLIGNKGKAAILGADASPINNTPKWMWLLWGVKDVDLTVIGYEKYSNTVSKVLTGGWTEPVAGENDGADAHLPSNVELPKAGNWAMLLYCDGKLFDTIILDVKKIVHTN